VNKISGKLRIRVADFRGIFSEIETKVSDPDLDPHWISIYGETGSGSEFLESLYPDQLKINIQSIFFNFFRVKKHSLLGGKQALDPDSDPQSWIRNRIRKYFKTLIRIRIKSMKI